MSLNLDCLGSKCESPMFSRDGCSLEYRFHRRESLLISNKARGASASGSGCSQQGARIRETATGHMATLSVLTDLAYRNPNNILLMLDGSWKKGGLFSSRMSQSNVKAFFFMDAALLKHPCLVR